MKIDNDANCAAFGETLAGAAKGRKNVIMLTLGTGVGGGIVLDGKIYAGADGMERNSATPNSSMTENFAPAARKAAWSHIVQRLL